MTAEALRVWVNALEVRVIALWERMLGRTRRRSRRLRLCESLPLGERRFVAVVEFEAERFLVGGTPSSLVLLSRLSDAEDSEDGEAGLGSRKRADAAAVLAGKLRVEKC